MMASAQKHGGVRSGHSITLRGPGHLVSDGRFQLGATSALYIAYCECGCSAIHLTPEGAYQRLADGTSKPTNTPGVDTQRLRVSSQEENHVHKLIEKLNKES